MGFERTGVVEVLIATVVASVGVASALLPLGSETVIQPATASAGGADGEVRDIYLLIGQSNMAGRAPIEEEDLASIEGAYLFDDENQWVPVSNVPMGVNRYSTVEEATEARTRLGPGYTFARRLVEENDEPIGLVVNARGATTISQWRKDDYTGDVPLYAEAVRRTQEALDSTPGSRLAGIIWHQGEGDNNASAAEYYLPMLAVIVENLRTDLDSQPAVFIAGEVGQWQGRGSHINPLIRQVPSVIGNSAWVTSDGLTTHETGSDPWGPHFDSASQRELGERYAEAAVELTGSTLW